MPHQNHFPCPLIFSLFLLLFLGLLLVLPLFLPSSSVSTIAFGSTFGFALVFSPLIYSVLATKYTALSPF